MPVDTRALTDAQLDAFGRDGVVVVRGLLDQAAVNDVRIWTDNIQGLPQAPGKYMKYFEDSLSAPGTRILSRVENFCPYHAGFDALARGPEILGTIAELFGEAAVLFKDKINFKMPGGDGFKAHQDVQAGWQDYAALHITALVSIDAADEENGCLEVAGGGGRGGLIGKMWEPLSEDELDEAAFELVPTEPGDAIIFDSLLPHRSAPNMSDRPRRVLYLTYNRLSEGDHRAQYYADKRLSYPPDCEREPGKQYVFRV